MTTGTSLVDADVQGLFRTHYLGLVRLAVQLVDDQDSAEDVVQDVFAALQTHPRCLEDPLRYLRTAVVNRSRSVLRHRRVVRRLIGDREREVEAADATSLRRAERVRVLGAVSRLPRRQREVVVLRYYEHLSVGEIGVVLGISPGAVSSSLTRALATLTELLEG